MEIRKYDTGDEAALFALLRREGPEWDCYQKDNYSRALRDSITFVACEDDMICGFSRSMDDNGLYIYVLDLLVDKAYRGQRLGHRLMEATCREYPGQIPYVMSDADGFYEKMGYKREGSIFEVILSDGEGK